MPDGADLVTAPSHPSARGHDAAAEATILAVVAQARHVPSLEREAFAARLAAMPARPGLVVVHTCHRVEAILAPASAGAELPVLPAGAEVLRDAAAVRHLISLACGLESAVVGETQILHQLRETFALRRAEGGLEPVIDRLFQAALHAGRAAHGWLTGSPRSLADVALDRIEPSGSLEGRTVLVVGVGRMGRLAAFAVERRGGRVLVANRSHDRALALAAEVGGGVTTLGRDGEIAALPRIDGVVVAIGGAWPLGPADLDRLAADRVPVVDLSSPPAVPAALAAALGDRSWSVDDLAAVDALPDDRLRRRLEKLVFETGSTYCEWLRHRDAVPAIHGVVEAAERIRQAEVEWLRRRMTDLGEDDLRAVEQMSHRLVAAILHAPLAALNDDATGELADAARTLFGI